ATISTAVALFSGFFNILQLTAIDDFDLPGRENNFTLNLSRPIEWIATCPIMQLKLVVLAGARVPSYRRFMMPLICVSVLLCGTASMFTGDALRYAWYAFGMFLALVMFYHNALQIRENSEGEESILQGDSDFRKLSILLIVTWFPFPLWFCLSVEGWGIITDYLVIEMGWVVLNIVSKFTFIIWMQRMKMVHGKKLEAARELYGLSPSDHVDEDQLKKKAHAQGAQSVGLGGVSADKYGLGAGEEADSEAKLVEIVSETMVTLGMSTHTDRLIRLLVENGVTNTAVLERLNGERCMELNLPWALIDSAQKRWIAEKMNMGQDQGGQIEKEDPFKKILEANKERMTGKQAGRSQHPSFVERDERPDGGSRRRATGGGRQPSDDAFPGLHYDEDAHDGGDHAAAIGSNAGGNLPEDGLLPGLPLADRQRLPSAAPQVGLLPGSCHPEDGHSEDDGGPNGEFLRQPGDQHRRCQREHQERTSGHGQHLFLCSLEEARCHTAGPAEAEPRVARRARGRCGQSDNSCKEG
ncbi:hisS, partial [Symbiodinium sp. KB8]